jgi:hypothetical protein
VEGIRLADWIRISGAAQARHGDGRPPVAHQGRPHGWEAVAGADSLHLCGKNLLLIRLRAGSVFRAD